MAESVAEGVDRAQDLIIGHDPTIIVGLGGAGGEVVGRLKRLLQEQFGSDINRLNTIQFLVIDADRYERLSPQVRETIRRETEFLRITTDNQGNPIVPSQAYQGLKRQEAFLDLDRWFDPNSVRFLPSEAVDRGADCRRAVGRFYYFLARNAVQATLEQKIRDAHENASALGTGPRGGLRCLLISSCAGGTGSSIFMDVAYHLLRLGARYTPGNAVPRLEGAVMLPEIWAQAVRKSALIQEPRVRANAYAFFRELDYLLKHPEELNDFAADYHLGNRTPPPEGAGLPTGINQFFRVVYLLGGSIGGDIQHVFKSHLEFFAYGARLLYHNLMVKGNVHYLTQRVANIETALMENDKLNGRPRRYAAVGYAELRFPREVFLDYLRHRYLLDFVSRGMVGAEGDLTPDEVERALEPLRTSILNDFLNPLEERLQGLINDYLANLPVEVKSLNVEQIMDHYSEATTTHVTCAPAMWKLFNALRNEMLRTLPARIARLQDSLLEGRGGAALAAVLAKLDTDLENKANEHDRLQSQANADAKSQLAELHGAGGFINADEVHKSLNKGFGGKTAKIRGFFQQLRAVAHNNLAANQHAILSAMVREISGGAGTDHFEPQHFDEEAGVVRPGPSRTGILDVARLAVSRQNRFLSDPDLLAEWAPQKKLAFYWSEGESSPCTTYLPDAGSYAAVAGNADLDSLYNSKASWLNDPALRRKMIQEFTARLAAGSGPSFSQSAQETELPKLWAKLTDFLLRDGRQIFDAELSKLSLWPLFEAKPLAEQQTLVSRLKSQASPACPLNINVLHEEDKKFPSYLVPGTNNRRALGEILSETELSNTIDLTQDQISFIKVDFLIPVFAVTEIMHQSDSYFSRDRLQNRPHTDRRFEENSITDNIQVAKDDGVASLEAVLIARALEVYTSMDEQRRRLEQRFSWQAVSRGRKTAAWHFLSPGERSWQASLFTVTVDEKSGQATLKPSHEYEACKEKPVVEVTYADLADWYDLHPMVKKCLCQFIELLIAWDTPQRAGAEYLRDALQHFVKLLGTKIEETRIADPRSRYLETLEGGRSSLNDYLQRFTKKHFVGPIPLI